MSEKILVTGFGPFGEHKINASWESVKLLPETINNLQVVKVEIPVVYSQVQEIVPLLWKTHSPKLVIHVGVSSFTNELTIETCAHRDGYKRKDCLNNLQECACTENKEDCLKSKLEIEEICEKINDIGLIKAKSSDNAGRYLCEFIYYTSLDINKEKTLFVHVPPTDKPYSLETIAKGLESVIKFALLPKQEKDH